MAARTQADMPGDGTVEAVFELSSAPRPHAASTPLLHCVQADNLPHDVVLASMTCDDHGEVKSILGYSFEQTYPNAKPFYRCNASEVRSDLFLSWDAGCEGHQVIGQIGYALDPRNGTPR
jgi:hypothetical protein